MADNENYIEKELELIRSREVVRDKIVDILRGLSLHEARTILSLTGSRLNELVTIIQ